MPVTYARYIYIGGRRFDTRIKTCSFSYDDTIGCNTCSLTIPTSVFDDFLGIEYGDKIDIRYGSAKSSRWWLGTVTSLRTDLTGGITIQGAGMYTFLDAVRPHGRFGYLVETQAPDNVTASGASTGGTIPAGTYDYKVSSVDALGETTADHSATVVLTGATSSVSVSWDAAQGAKGYRLYRKKSTDVNWVYWTVSETTFIDTNGTTGTTTAGSPVTSTATSPTIAAVDVDSVVDHLLDTFLPEELTKGTVSSAGANVDLDDYDLEETSGTLREVLQTLAKIAGDVICYVDAQGAVHFVDRGNPDEDTIPNAHKFTVGRSGGDLIGSVSSASREQTADGLSQQLVTGEDALHDPDQNEGDFEDDSAEEDIITDDGTIKVNPKYLRLGYMFMTVGSTRTVQDIWGDVKSIPFISPVTKYFFLNSDNTRRDVTTDTELRKMLQTFPGLYKMYRGSRQTAHLNDEMITAVLDFFNRIIARITGNRYDSPVDYDDTGARQPAASMPRFGIDYLPGVKTQRLATTAAMNALQKKPLLSDKFSIGISDVTQLVIPGVDIIQFTTRRGVTYKLRVTSADYSLTDERHVTLNCGDEPYRPDEEHERLVKQVARLSERSHSVGIWRPANSSILIP